MHSAPQSLVPVGRQGCPEVREKPAGSVYPDLRPFLTFLRRPAFAASPPGRLSVWRWLGWLGLLLLVSFLSGLLDGILIHGR